MCKNLNNKLEFCSEGILTILHIQHDWVELRHYKIRQINVQSYLLICIIHCIWHLHIRLYWRYPHISFKNIFHVYCQAAYGKLCRPLIKPYYFQNEKCRYISILEVWPSLCNDYFRTRADEERYENSFNRIVVSWGKYVLLRYCWA